MEKKFNVLVTDSTYKHSLAAVRCLGKNKLRVITCSDKFSPTKFSVFSKASFSYNHKNFARVLLEELKKNNVEVVMPIGYYSNIACSKYKDKIKKFSSILISDYDKMIIASDKEKMSEFVKQVNVPVPKTWVINNIGQAKKIKFDGEMIIKSSKEMKGKKVEYLTGGAELISKLKERLVFGPQIVQERIFGFGCGFLALYKEGKLKASFQHKRIRQYPFSGGVSSAAESYYDPKLEEFGKKILDSLKWEGVAMVEFIYDVKDKKYKFIELNPKFWGSLDLAISSGVEFPYLYYLAAKNINFKAPKYAVGVRFQWVLPEDTLRIKSAPDKAEALKEYLRDMVDSKVNKDICYLFSDPLPTLLRIGGTIIKFFKDGS